MGPSAFTDGEHEVADCRQPQRNRFNGAVGLHRRRADWLHAGSSTDECFNGAVGLHRRRACRAGRPWSLRARFNGAVGLHRRRGHARQQKQAPSVRLQWGRRPSPTERSCGGDRLRLPNWLQWGRRPSPTESGPSLRCRRLLGRASMGPSAFTDGETSIGGSALFSSCCFNGAVGLHRRRVRHYGSSNQPLNVGFNGAVGLHRRRGGPWNPFEQVDDRLQWGRRPSPTESRGPPGAPLGRGTASMGPSAFTDGEASRIVRVEPSRTPLQWGRRPSPTESAGAPPSTALVHQLQWGRRPSPTERAVPRTRRSPASRCFNGAVGLHRRRGAQRARAARVECFNGAVGLHRRRGVPGRSIAQLDVESLQWGRRPSPTESCDQRTKAARPSAASMGPSAFTDGEAS